MKILPPLEDDDTMIAALCYPFWYIASWMVFLSKKKDEPFVKFHAIQSLYFGLALLLINLLLTLIVFGISRCVPSAAGIIRQDVVWKGYMWKGLFLLGVFLVYLFLVVLGMIVVFYYAYKTYRGVYFKIPFIGQRIEDRYFAHLRDSDEEPPGAQGHLPPPVSRIPL